MKDWADKVISILYALFGAGLAFAVYCFALGGDRYVLLGRHRSFWVGPGGLSVSLALGALLGFISYIYYNREIGGPDFESEADALLFAKRAMVVITSLTALAVLWQFAHGM